MGGVPLGTTLQPNTTPCASLNGFGPLHTPGLSRNVPSIQHGTGGEGREVVGWGGLSVCCSAMPQMAVGKRRQTPLHSTPLPVRQTPTSSWRSLCAEPKRHVPRYRNTAVPQRQIRLYQHNPIYSPRNRETISRFSLSGCRVREGGGGVAEGNAGSVQLVNNLD